jgi:anti-sigma factor RsiW
MQHLDEGFLHALADGEVPSGELGPVREHLESCESVAPGWMRRGWKRRPRGS